MTLTSETTKDPSVLVVDDDPGVRWAVTKLLVAKHYAVTSVENAQTALDKVRQKSFDLIICDVHMPGMNGLDFLNALKKIDPATASVVITSSDDVSVAVQAMKSGALGFVPKPFTINELLESIDSAMESARMVRETLEMKLYLPLLENACIALLNALEEKDKSSKGHNNRVAELAAKVARSAELGLSPEAINDIYLGALFHDVGKIGIPDKILHKPEPLTPEEMQVMARHPDYGADLIEKVQNMTGVARIIRSHHERYDGKGYPRGLAGNDIPLEARIVSVVDTFDTLTNQQVYTGNKSVKEAVEEIKGCIGSQFDPQIVELFLVSLINPEI